MFYLTDKTYAEGCRETKEFDTLAELLQEIECEVGERIRYDGVTSAERDYEIGYDVSVGDPGINRKYTTWKRGNEC